MEEGYLILVNHQNTKGRIRFEFENERKVFSELFTYY